MPKPRISYIDPATVKDPAMIAEFERCARILDELLVASTRNERTD